MKDCKTCGAPLEGDPLQKSWTCGYCKTVNFNEDLIKEHIAKIDFTKAHNLLQVAMTAYDCGDFTKAQEVFERVLVEDSGNLDAWVYSALAVSFATNITRYEASAKKALAYLNKAQAIDSSSDIFKVGRSVCANNMGRVALTAASKHFDDAKKAWHAYESTDKARATSMTNDELNSAFLYAEHALSLDPDDLKISGKIAVLVVLSDRFYKSRNPNKTVVEKSQLVLSAIKERNPALYAELAKELEPTKSGCAGAASLLLFAFVVGSVSIARAVYNFL
jgi:tetratricopeptide (TPR) repeat protein